METFRDTTSTTRKAAAYLRCSTQGQYTDNQRPDIERLVHARGLDLNAVYAENISAAAKVRPEFDKMMAAAHRGEFEVLVVWSLDRLGRSMVGNLQTVLELDRKGVRVLSVRESFLDADLGPARQLLLGVLGWVAEQERVRMGDRVRAGLDRARRQGKKLGRPKAHVPLTVALQLKADGESIRAIGKKLGVSSSAVHRALQASRNPQLRGEAEVAGST